jgi:predicted DNA-binding transcriptional regulator AlpA
LKPQTLEMLRWRGMRAARGRSRSNLYANINAGLFPPPVRLKLRAVGWPECDLVAQRQARIAERDARSVEPPQAGDADRMPRGSSLMRSPLKFAIVNIPIDDILVDGCCRAEQPESIKSPLADRLGYIEAIAAFRGEKVHSTRYLIRIGVMECGTEANRPVANNAALLAKHAARPRQREVTTLKHLA